MTLPTDTVLQGDCRAILRSIESNSVDFVLTDPPYGVRYTSRDGRTIQGDASMEWLQESFAEIYRVLRNDRYCVSFYGWRNAIPFLHTWEQAGFRPMGHFVWPKPYSSADRVVQNRHEQAYLLAKGNPRRPDILLPDVLDWEFSGNSLHPTQKPVSALIPLILTFSKPGDIVLDPFCGSGSTLVAAKLVGRRGLGVEVDEKYAAVAAERLKKVSS